MTKTRIAWLTLALLATGCSSTDSDNVRTQGIQANYDVIGRADGSTRIEARFSVGSGGVFDTLLELDGGDEATAYHSGNFRTLTKDPGIDAIDIVYSAVFNEDLAGQQVRVAFERDEGISALNSIVTLPAAFTLAVNDDRYNRDETLIATWAPAQPGSLRLHWLLDCQTGSGATLISSRTQTVNDSSGRYDVLIASLLNDANLSELQTAGGCDVTLEVRRRSNGTLDSAFDAGDIEGSQRRLHEFRINPVL